MIKVHHLSESRSLRILWLLEELGQPYEVIRYERNPETRLAPPELLAVHPLGKSPVLEIDGLRLAESGAIVEYLCTRFAPGMIPPSGSQAHMEHMELLHAAEGSVMVPFLLHIYVGLLGEAGAPLHPRIGSEIASHLSYLEGALRPSGHFVLDALSAVDIMMSFPVMAALNEDSAAAYPKLAKFAAAMAQRPAFQRAVAAGGGT